MTSLPLVSVIIPCYNAENFVESAVRSIMEQTYSNLEIIVINDCSSDNTGEILKRLAEEDPRIKYIENEQNLKLSKTLNKGINLAKGDYIARMDSDDISLPVRLEKQVEFMLSNKNIDIVGCNMQHMDVYSRRLLYRSHMSTEHNDIIKKMAWKCELVHPSILAKRNFFIDLKGFNEEIAYAEDYELWIRAILLNKKFSNLDDVLLYYRIHCDQMSSNNLKHLAVIRGFLLQAFRKTKKIRYLLGFFIQTKAFFFIRNIVNLFRR